MRFRTKRVDRGGQPLGRCFGQRATHGRRDTIPVDRRSARSQRPNAKVVVTAPLWDDNPAPGWLLDDIAVVHGVANEQGAVFLDLGQPLAGHPEFVAYDGVHPNDAGHAAIADAFVNAWQAAYSS